MYDGNSLARMVSTPAQEHQQQRHQIVRLQMSLSPPVPDRPVLSRPHAPYSP